MATGWHYHPDRAVLLAEAHARPSTPLASPMVATRLATLSGGGRARRRPRPHGGAVPPQRAGRAGAGLALVLTVRLLMRRLRDRLEAELRD